MSATGAQAKRSGRGDRRSGGSRGFTLIETCISLVIMMIAGLGVVTLFTFAVTFNHGASDRARAAAIAQQRMEIIRNTDFDNLNAAFAAANTTVVQQGTNATDVRRFDVSTTIVDDLVIDATPRRKTITVIVRPQDFVGALNAANPTPAANQRRRWSSGVVTLVTQRASSEMGPN